MPTYKETANIPRPNTTYDAMRDARDTPGYALARLLGALPEASKAHQQMAEEGPGPQEQEQLAALAAMGAQRDRLKIAKGRTFFGLLQDKETTMDTYEVERGRRDADLFAGQLRDAYAEAGLSTNDDPAAFAAFAEQYRNMIFDEKLKDVDPAYYHGFITRVGSVFEDMAKAHAGHLDGFVKSKNKAAFEQRLDSKLDLELTARRERDAFGNLMDNLMGAESGGNYNAFHANGNNQDIRFTDMTIGEVLDWQKSGAWKRYGAESSAVGKYQFIEKTLRETVRDAGISLDTKFTPAVQDKLIFHRLTKTRGMQDYLEGKISAEEFLDNGLALEFAGLKKTNGRGHYDGDGKNKATLSSRKALAALIAFKEAYLQDPASVSKTAENGKIVIDAEDQKPDDSLPGMLSNVEADYGIPQTEARAEAANALIRKMESDPSIAEREDLEDVMADAKIPKKDRQRVIEARDRIRKEVSQKAHLEDNKKAREILKLSDRFIRGDDPEALEEIKAQNPKIYSRLLDLVSEPADPDNLDNEGFIESADTSSENFPQVALKAFADGTIDRETYSAVMEEFDIKQIARPILNMRAVKKTVDMVRSSIPGETLRETFDDQLAVQIADMARANEGRRPSLAEINQVAQALQQSLIAMHQADIETRMSRPEYNGS